MKKMKRYLSLALALVLSLALALPAMAAGTEGNVLTINFKRGGHVYEAYQIFSGDYDNTADVNKDDKADKTLSNVQWGTGVDGDALLAALKADTVIGSVFKDCVTAADVANAMKGFASTTTTSVSDQANAFAKVVSAHLTTTKADSDEGTAQGTGENAYYQYKISGLPDGYYFVKDRDNSVTENGNSYTKFLLQLLGDETVEAKAIVESHDKVIEGGQGTLPGTTEVKADLDGDPDTTGDVKYNNESIGDTVPFKITTKVPDMREYDRYQFALEDTMEKGLTFNNDVTITVGTKTLTKGTLGTNGKVADGDFAVRVTPANAPTTSKTDTKVEIIFGNFIQYQNQTGADIVIRYTATLNEAATIGAAGNKNTSSLKYSINPNQVGGKDEFDKDDPKGTTPESWTYTYVTGVKLTKVEAGNTAKTLTGAQFKIEGTRLNQTLVTGYKFVEASDGTYWKLKDGSYTTDNPSTPGMDTSKYESTNQKYSRETFSTVTTASGTGTKVSETLEVDDNGVLTFKGLAAGMYTITEVKSPAGYNLLSDPIYIKIEMTNPTATDNQCTWTVYHVDKDGNYLDKDREAGTMTTTTNKEQAEVLNADTDGSVTVYAMKVENSAGSRLPSTGGIGTTIFYVVGGILVAAAGILLVTKRRMRAR